MTTIILKGWRYGVFIGTVVGAIGLTMYPIFVHPLLHIDDYKKHQAYTREGVNQEAIQPGGNVATESCFIMYHE
uniref:Small integral membrane protein 20 n=1 Tax=Strigamia maritima TaxID=126957 RepID=T1J401_STRMM